MNNTSTLLGLSAALVSSSLFAAESEQSTLDKIFGAATFYENKDASVIQKIAFTGRLQYDYSYFSDSETGLEADETNWRRARAGFKIQTFDNFTIHAEMDMDLENYDPVYNQLTDAYIAYQPSKNLKFKLGKQSAGFTLAGATSSKKTTHR